PILIGLALVVVDSLLTLAGPYLIRAGIDHGVLQHSSQALVGVSIVFLAVTLVDWWAMWAESLWDGRVAERILLALRVRVFAHMQRLGLDFYDREMAGRLLTRVTSDVETVSDLVQSGIVNAVVNLVQFAGIGVLLFVM